MGVAALRIQGMSPVALKAEIENRYRNKTYKVPEKQGVSYMIAPVMRTWMLPDWNVSRQAPDSISLSDSVP